jgi:hypothetical protein
MSVKSGKVKRRGGSGGIVPPFLTSALDGEGSASRPGRFIAGERTTGTHRCQNSGLRTVCGYA